MVSGSMASIARIFTLVVARINLPTKSHLLLKHYISVHMGLRETMESRMEDQ